MKRPTDAIYLVPANRFYAGSIPHLLSLHCAIKAGEWSQGTRLSEPQKKNNRGSDGYGGGG